MDRLTPTKIKALYEQTVNNMQMFPALGRLLGEQLNVTPSSILRLGVGYYPSQNCWLFPERNAQHELIGLSARGMDGSKWMIPGSKRGLTYALDKPGDKDYDRKRWARVTSSNPCPLCGKADGCLYPEGEHNDPAAICCVRIAEGSIKEMKIGYLHILDPDRNQDRMQAITADGVSYPKLIVEGASDVLAGLDLGFNTIGKPSGNGGLELLLDYVGGSRVIILGENDDGAGRKGMEATFVKLHTKCSLCLKVMPPEGIKDLRRWKKDGLTTDQLLSYVDKVGDSVLSPDIFPSDDPAEIANRWLRTNHFLEGTLTLRRWAGSWVKFNGRCYESFNDKEMVFGDVYRFLANKSFVKDGGEVKPYRTTTRNVYDIVNACQAFCPIDHSPPTWLSANNPVAADRLIVFQNGVMDIDEYLKGNVQLHSPTPDLFVLAALPYSYDPDASSPLIEATIADIFDGDQESIDLLYQWLGYQLLPDNRFEKFMIFQGRSRGGKGLCARIIEGMLGDRNCAATSYENLATRFGYEPLLGKLSAVMGDARSLKQRYADAVLEKLLVVVGGDTVPVDRKGIAGMPLVRLFTRFTMAMNTLPAFTDNTKALENRMLLLKFNKTYSGREDTTLKDRIHKEAANGLVINLALKGLQQLYRQGRFTIPEASKATIKAFQELVAPIGTFVERCIELEDGASEVTTDYLYSVWRWWCTREGNYAGRKAEFIRDFIATITESTHVRQGEVCQSGLLIGIKLTQWSQEEFLRGG